MRSVWAKAPYLSYINTHPLKQAAMIFSFIALGFSQRNMDLISRALAKIPVIVWDEGTHQPIEEIKVKKAQEKTCWHS